MFLVEEGRPSVKSTMEHNTNSHVMQNCRGSKQRFVISKHVHGKDTIDTHRDTRWDGWLQVNI